MTTEIDQIVSRYDERRAARGAMFQRMREVKDNFEGRVDIVLPEIAQSEKPMVPNLLHRGVNQLGMRVASTMANVTYLPVRPGIKRSEGLARDRRMATLGWLERSAYDVALHRRARWLVAYATSPVQIRPNSKLGIPSWEVRDPLCTFEAPTPRPDDMEPADSIFDFTRTWKWILDTYPEHADRLRRYKKDTRADTKFTCIEFVDDAETVLAVIGERDRGGPGVIPSADRPYSSPIGSYGNPGNYLGTEYVVELERSANRAGICPVVVPGGIALDPDTPNGMFDGMIGMYQGQAMLWALELNAIKRGIYPNTWAVFNGEDGEIVTTADGQKGVLGEIRGGDVKVVTENPSYFASQARDYLENAQHVDAGIPREWGGESPTAVRTGRRGDAILSAVVDHTVQESQLLLERSLKHEIERAVAVAKSYFGKRRQSFYVSWRGAPRQAVDYVANEVFEEDGATCQVTYAQPGTDINTLSQNIVQRVSTQMMSQRTGRELDPLVDDADLEHKRVIVEGLEHALLVGIEQQAQTGQMAPADIGALARLVNSGDELLWDAIDTVHRAAQERQASEVAPVTPGSPEAQPGIAAPGAGAEAGTVPPPPASLTNLSQMLADLHHTAPA